MKMSMTIVKKNNTHDMKTIKKLLGRLVNIDEENNIEIDIEADGGIKVNNVQNVKTKGANIIVSGSGIINFFRRNLQWLK